MRTEDTPREKKKSRRGIRGSVQRSRGEIYESAQGGQREIYESAQRGQREVYESARRTKRRRNRLRLPFFVCALLCLILLAALGADIARHRKRSQTFSQTKQIPQSLLEFKEKYPEAAAFVDGYPENKEKTYDPDVSGEVQKGEIPLFLQWDERWGYETYGNDFLGVNACGPTTLSMVVCGLSGSAKWNPLEVARFSDEQGYYIIGEGTSWDLMTKGAQELGLSVRTGEVNREFILDNLYHHRPVICSMLPGDFTYTGHFIVLTGVDDEGKIVLNDCNSRQRSKKHWELDVLLSQIKGLWAYALDESAASVGV